MAVKVTVTCDNCGKEVKKELGCHIDLVNEEGRGTFNFCNAKCAVLFLLDTHGAQQKALKERVYKNELLKAMECIANMDWVDVNIYADKYEGYTKQ